MAHLWVALSAHGYGHLAQVAPVLEALARHLTTLRITVQTELPEVSLRERLSVPFRRVALAGDVTIPMSGPTAVQWDKAIAAVEAFHADWDHRLGEQEAALRADPPDCVLADVPYLPLAGATRVGLPRLAFCSLNWADILGAVPRVAERLAGPLAVMREVYRNVDLFIQPAPSMPMAWVSRRRAVGPVASLGANRRAEILSHLDLPDTSRLVLVSLGGIPDAGALAWPSLDGVHWLVPRDWPVRGQDLHPIHELPCPFRDLVASADLFVTKPGYGAYAEAACHGLPVISVAREDWAEAPYLEAWLDRHVPWHSITLEAFRSGRIAAQVADLLMQARPQPIAPSGVTDTMALLLPFLRRG